MPARKPNSLLGGSFRSDVESSFCIEFGDHVDCAPEGALEAKPPEAKAFEHLTGHFNHLL